MATGNELEWVQRALMVTAELAAPILIAALVIGVLISILQVATQIQEMTLSFVPKMVVVFFVLLLFGPWMMHTLGDFARDLFHHIPAVAHE